MITFSQHKLLWSLAALLFFVVSLVLTMPAKHIVNRLALPANVSIAGVSGTLWQGQAQRVVVAQTQLNNLHWNIDSLPLLWGELGASIKLGNARQLITPYARGQLSYHLFSQEVSADNLTVRVAAQEVLDRANLPMQVLAKGAVETRLTQASLSLATGQPQCKTLNGQGSWRNASVIAPSGLVALGDFKAQLGCPDGQLQIQVNEPNKLNLTFVAQGSSMQNLSVSGKFNIPNDMPQELQAVARFLGTPGADGFTQFTW